MDRLAASLGKIIMELCGVTTKIKIDTFFKPHNAGNDAVMTCSPISAKILPFSKTWN